MIKLTSAMKAMVAHQKLGFMATVCEDGTPNLSPKGQTFILDDSHLVVGEVKSPQTLQNLRHQPVAEINVVDPFVRKGFRFKGPCEIQESGERFEMLLDHIKSMGACSIPNAVIVMRVERAAALISPIYQSGIEESVVSAQWRSRLLDGFDV